MTWIVERNTAATSAAGMPIAAPSSTRPRYRRGSIPADAAVVMAPIVARLERPFVSKLSFRHESEPFLDRCRPARPRRFSDRADHLGRPRLAPTRRDLGGGRRD